MPQITMPTHVPMMAYECADEWGGQSAYPLQIMGSPMELRESEMSTCGTLGHALEVAIAHTSYMRGA